MLCETELCETNKWTTFHLLTWTPWKDLRKESSGGGSRSCWLCRFYIVCYLAQSTTIFQYWHRTCDQCYLHETEFYQRDSSVTDFIPGQPLGVKLGRMVDKKAKKTQEDDTENVKVFLRLRPMDKLETSKRSKDCIELHENPKLITVESPVLGSFDSTFDQVPDFSTHVLFNQYLFSHLGLSTMQVFDEYTPQLEVYKESVSSIPRNLLGGISCAVMAYGQTGSGKVCLTSTSSFFVVQRS